MSSWWWQTRFIVASLLVCFVNADENTRIDPTVTQYVATYLLRYRGINNVASIDSFIEKWLSGCGDRAVDVRGHESLRLMTRISLEARKTVLAHIEQATAQTHTGELPPEVSRRFELVCDFFGFTILPGYIPRNASDLLHRDPGVKRRPLVRPLYPEPIIRSPLRERHIELEPHVEQLVEVLEHLSTKPDLADALSSFSMRDTEQQPDESRPGTSNLPSSESDDGEILSESHSALADTHAVASKKGGRRRGRTAAARRREKRLQRATAGQQAAELHQSTADEQAAS